MQLNIRILIIGILAMSIAVMGTITALSGNTRYPDLSLPPLQIIPDVRTDGRSDQPLSCSLMLADNDIPSLGKRINGADFLISIEPGIASSSEINLDESHIQDRAEKISAVRIRCSA